MELTIKLEDNADFSFIKEQLSKIKGVKSFEILKQDAYVVNDEKGEYRVLSNEKCQNKNNEIEEEISDEEYQNLLNQLLDKSFKQFEEGKFVEHSEKLMNKIFNK